MPRGQVLLYQFFTVKVTISNPMSPNPERVQTLKYIPVPAQRILYAQPHNRDHFDYFHTLWMNPKWPEQIVK